jgi:hypothetical protein
MRARVRSWLVGLIADGITEANKRGRVEVVLDGEQIISAIRRRNQRKGLPGSAA